jgi:hypothetical protein
MIKWIQALESGTYTQGEGCLTLISSEGESSHCCLGVACQLYQDEVGDLEVDKRSALDIQGNEIPISYDKQFYSLPPKVQKWLGLGTKDGTLQRGNDGDMGNLGVDVLSLAFLNDKGTPFIAIAAMLRAGLVK